MASGGLRRGGIIQGINVTPLVDIVLVLLIIFIVTAKIVVTPAVPLDLPKASQSQELQTVLSVVVPIEGTLLVDGEPLVDAALRERARSALQRDPGLRAVIQADRNVKHGRVIEVLDSLQAAGLTRVAFGAVRPDAPALAAPGRATP